MSSWKRKRTTVTGRRAASLNFITLSMPRWNCSNSTAQPRVSFSGTWEMIVKFPASSLVQVTSRAHSDPAEHARHAMSRLQITVRMPAGASGKALRPCPPVEAHSKHDADDRQQAAEFVD